MGAYERVDYSIEKALEKLKGDATESVIIIQEYPEIDYVLAYRKSSIQPWVAAWAYNGKNSWGQGHYFANLMDAIEYIRTKQGKPNWYRLDELASKAIDGLFEDDAYEAKIYCEEELELTEEENEYFGISEKEEEELEW